MTLREMQSCSGCVFCIMTEIQYQHYVYICNLGLDEIFHERNHDKWDTLGCGSINEHPTTPCKARYTDEEMQKMLRVQHGDNCPLFM